MTHAERKARLEALLLGFQALWRPQPFKIETPGWCSEYPALASDLLALDDDTCDRVAGDNLALIGLLSRHIPALDALAELIDLPAVREMEAANEPSRLFTDIPGRKQAQITAYAAAIGQPRAPLIEWCAGKGHLGRLLAYRWHWPVASLEIDASLCESGEALARHAHVDCMQHFIPVDALAEPSAHHLKDRHAIALHACGDLHTRLIRSGVGQASPAIDVAPCCYYRTANDRYVPFNETVLELSRDDLRLAVTETATASAKQRRTSRRSLAWKLAWVELRKALTGMDNYQSFPSIPEVWLRGSFRDFIEHMAARAGLPLGAAPVAAYEARGETRAARMLRLQLARLAFRRPLETWLLSDMAVFLENHGYAVSLQTFCVAALTPRNLLLSARRYT